VSMRRFFCMGTVRHAPTGISPPTDACHSEQSEESLLSAKLVIVNG